MPALTLRPAPIDRGAAVVAVAGGAWLAVFVAVVGGVEVTSGVAVWVAVAGACACLGGLVAGGGGGLLPAALLVVAAAAAAVLAVGAARADNPPAVRMLDVAPRDEGRPARPHGAAQTHPRGGTNR